MRHNTRATAQIICDLRFRRKVAELHAKGPRITAELVAEILAQPFDRMTTDERLDLFLAITDEALDVAGGRDLPPIPLHLVSPR